MNSRTTLWVYLHFPLLPLEMLCNSPNPGPTVLLDERRARLWLCNHQATAEGLRTGMAIATASSLCPQLSILPRRPRHEAAQLESLALWAGGFSAHVSLQPDQGLLLEIASMLDYFGGFKALLGQLSSELQTLGFSTQIATGHTPLAARLLARSGGFIAEDAEQHLQRLQQLPTEALELDPRSSERLTGMGLFRLQQLLCLPRDELTSRLGTGLLEHIDRLTGQQADPQPCFTPPQRFCRRLELLHEASTSQALLFPLRRLLAELQGYLQSRQLQALMLELRLSERHTAQEDSDTPALTVRLNHSHGEHRSEAWLELWQLRLERLALQQPVIALQLEVCRFRELDGGSQELFISQHHAEDGAQLISRLQTRLGTQAVRHLGLNPDHRPEHSWQALPPEQHSAPASLQRQSTTLWQAADPQQPRQALDDGRRPGWLLQQPRKLPTARIGPIATPVQQRAQQQSSPQLNSPKTSNTGRIRLLQGPERIVTGWWDAQPIRRDYYTARWPDGRLGWLFRDDTGDWYLHGWFG